jgi:hypothetical protein
MNAHRSALPTLLLALALAMATAQAQTTNEAPSSAPPANAADQPLPTAVLRFESSDDALAKQGEEISTLLEADLSNSQHAITVERDEIEKVLNEQELGASGLVSADTAAKIGSLTGAKVLVTGRFFALGNQYMLVAKIISTETSRVYGVTTTINDLGSLNQGVQDLSGKIDGVLGSHRDVMVVTTETEQQRLQRLKAMVGPTPLPTVSIVISERDYTQPTVDPAAQTEMTMELQALGYTVINPDQSHKKADIAITGEAFSELGARHGNLVSSRGRVEIKVNRGASQELIWSDRDTEVCVDIGNRTAGKEALEKASDRLVERLLPKLMK